MPDPMEDRIQALEVQVAKLREQADTPKEKDNWDKLSSLSTLLSGVIIASIGIWVNHSLTTGQQRAQDAQAEATRAMEKAHNDAADKQAEQALKLQAAQAADSLAFQKQQANDEKEIERLRMAHQEQQAADALAQQREHDQAGIQLQQTQLAKDFLPQLESNGRSRSTALQLMAMVNPKEALILSENYSETSGDSSLRQTSESVILSLQKSSDPALSKAASDVRIKVAYAKRIQAIVNVFETGKTTRNYGETTDQSGELSYGGFLRNGEPLYNVVSQYCAAANAQQASALKPYLDRIKNGDEGLAEDATFKGILKDAAGDIAMQKIQDDAFEQSYWKPVQSLAASLGLRMPLSMAVLYDMATNQGISKARTFAHEANSKAGGSPAQGANEKAWTSLFVAVRSIHYKRLLEAPELWRMSDKRMDFFRDEIAKGNWNLDPPLEVNGVPITD